MVDARHSLSSWELSYPVPALESALSPGSLDSFQWDQGLGARFACCYSGLCSLTLSVKRPMMRMYMYAHACISV